MKSTLNAMLCLLPTFCAQSTILAKVFIIFAQNLLIAERRKRCAYRWHTQIVEYVCITARVGAVRITFFEKNRLFALNIRYIDRNHIRKELAIFGRVLCARRVPSSMPQFGVT